MRQCVLDWTGPLEDWAEGSEPVQTKDEHAPFVSQLVRSNEAACTSRHANNECDGRVV